MKAVTWQGKKKIAVQTVSDPIIQEPTDAIIKVTSSGLCGSDLHLYEVMTPFMNEGNILGHEPMGIVQEIGSSVTNLKVGDRVVVPFNISCGHCFMCNDGMQSQCETTQVREFNRGAALFGYTKLYGEVAGAQAEYLRVPHADYGAVKVPAGPSDDRFLYLSDVLPTAWQAVEYAKIPKEGTVVVFGLGPIGEMAARIAKYRGAKMVIGVDVVPDRLERAKRRGVYTVNAETQSNELIDIIASLTDGRGADAAIDAVGMEAHGSPGAKLLQSGAGMLPDVVAEKVFQKAGIDRLSALLMAMESVRRGGTLSIVGVYAGVADPLPLGTLFDRQITIKMGQANVRRWTDDILPLLTDKDELGVDDFATHHLSLDEAPEAYEKFQQKADGAFKIVFNP
ncbi:glutathione-dependent formaldehyde dehydrogenase [Candidatus Saccharibacteria bacterium]|nr:glutathione-dependent formaldehyde dehydrogenase [Candidatus Saccharibacteria bacterium]